MRRVAMLILIALLTGACATRRAAPAAPAAPARPAGVVGLASFYGEAFHGKTTASGIPFDMRAMVAAHPTYAFGTMVRVTNLANGRAVEVRIVDRGPAAGPRAAGVIIDLSLGAAQALDFIDAGRARVSVEILDR
jgi:rare lipoprotein A